MTTADPLVATTRTEDRRVGAVGRLAVVVGVVGLLLGVSQLVLPPMVPADQYSAPLTPMLATIVAIVLFLHHVALVPLVLLVARYAAPTGLGRTGAAIASVGLVGIAVAELVAVAAAHERGTTPITDLVDTGYAVPTVLLGLGEVLLGVAVVRAARWKGWARGLPLIAGVFVFVPLVFPSLIIGAPLSMIALSVWSLLYSALGVALLREERCRRG
jgi:hypothetical protein